MAAFHDRILYIINLFAVCLLNISTVHVWLQVGVAIGTIIYTGIRIYQILKNNGTDKKE